jgi:small subunit ribosomal protein S21
LTIEVQVRDNNIEAAIRVLKKKKLLREGIFKELKLRKNYEKPSERKLREKAESVKRFKKLMRKKKYD